MLQWMTRWLTGDPAPERQVRPPGSASNPRVPVYTPADEPTPSPNGSGTPLPAPPLTRKALARRLDRIHLDHTVLDDLGPEIEPVLRSLETDARSRGAAIRAYEVCLAREMLGMPIDVSTLAVAAWKRKRSPNPHQAAAIRRWIRDLEPGEAAGFFESYPGDDVRELVRWLTATPALVQRGVLSALAYRMEPEEARILALHPELPACVPAVWARAVCWCDWPVSDDLVEGFRALPEHLQERLQLLPDIDARLCL